MRSLIKSAYNENFIFRTTKVKDIAIGKEKNNSVFDLAASEPFASRLQNYFKLDTRISCTRNKNK